MIEIEIDLKGTTTYKDVIKNFYQTLRLPDHPDNTYSSWDALNSWSTYLEKDSDAIASSGDSSEHLHLVIRNYNDAARALQNETVNHPTEISQLGIFNSFLVDLTDNNPTYRGTYNGDRSMRITFEVHHGNY